MTKDPVGAVGRGLLRTLAVVAIVVGVLLVFVGLTQPNITGLVLGVVLVAVPGFLLSRSRRHSS